MPKFTEPLIVKKLKGGLWEVADGFEYHVGKKNSDDVIQVPKGFKTDFASVPRPFWMILPPDGQYTQATVLHDFLYNIQDRKRVACDAIFLEAMGVLGVQLWKRRVMYRAVRMFGWLPWNHGVKLKKQQKEKK